jgi:hypothetical protein
MGTSQKERGKKIEGSYPLYTIKSKIDRLKKGGKI